MLANFRISSPASADELKMVMSTSSGCGRIFERETNEFESDSAADLSERVDGEALEPLAIGNNFWAPSVR